MNSNHSFESIDCEDLDLLKAPSEYHSSPTSNKKGPPLIVCLLHSKTTIVIFALLQVALLSAVFFLGRAVISQSGDVVAGQVPFSKQIPAEFCGKTPAEARVAGCIFEVNNLAWLHPDCYDTELEEEWNNGPWSRDLEYWEQIGGIGRLSKDLIMAGEVEGMWVNMRQHRRHCLFVWKKYVGAVRNHRPMDNWTSSYVHSTHCIEMIGNDGNGYKDDEVVSYLTLKFPTCKYGPM